MSDTPAPLTLDSPVCQVLHCLPAKFVVDFANGIDVARDHLRVQRGRSSFYSRMYDGFTGQGARRQAEINASLTDGVEASLQWLGELSESLAHSNLAMAQVNDRVSALTRDVAWLAHYGVDTRQRLADMAHRLDARLQGMAREIVRIDLFQRARSNLDATFDKWQAGRLAALSPAARCYAALEELRWAALGDYCRRHPGQHECRELMQQVADRATAQLAADAAVSMHAPADTSAVWLHAPPLRPRQDGDDLRQALAYLAEGLDADVAPLVNSVAQQYPVSPAVPLIANARRVAEKLIQEVFPREAIYD